MGLAVGSVSVSIRGEDGAVHEGRWAPGAPDSGIMRAVPWRTFRWRHGQEHYSGTYWSSVMRGHVICESRLELTRLLYADLDRGTEAVLAQPFLLSARVDGGKRRHVPDFLILRRGWVPLVVDVKPRHLLARPKVAFSLGWAREAVESRGWEFEAWSEPLRSGSRPVLPRIPPRGMRHRLGTRRHARKTRARVRRAGGAGRGSWRGSRSWCSPRRG